MDRPVVLHHVDEFDLRIGLAQLVIEIGQDPNRDARALTISELPGEGVQSPDAATPGVGAITQVS
jgi:hypothetical protein